MFINQTMLESLKQYRIAHINSDFPAEYPYPGDEARGTSDHDPNVATFKWDPATVTFDPENPAVLQVSAPGGSLNAGALTLIVSVTVASGDINNAGLTVTLSPLAGGSSYTLNCIPTDVSGLTKTFSCTNPLAIPVATYDVIATVTGDYYYGEGYDGFTVYDPSLGFATGGGWFYWPDTADQSTGYPGDKTNFGFVMKYNKGGTSPKGSLLVVRHMADGTIARLKSNSLTGLAIQKINGCGIATFSGKATYMEWISGAYVNTGGNLFSSYASDCNEPGSGVDSFWIRSIGQLVLATPAGTNALIVEGGNIFVPHTIGKSK
jgi:hypothetical protein